MTIIDTRRKSDPCTVGIVIRGIPWMVSLWAPATLSIKENPHDFKNSSPARWYNEHVNNGLIHQTNLSRTYDCEIWLKTFAQGQNTTNTIAESQYSTDGNKPIPRTTYDESEPVLPKLKSKRLMANSCPLNDKEIHSFDAHGYVKNSMELGALIRVLR